jgi:hypothetical protein
MKCPLRPVCYLVIGIILSSLLGQTPVTAKEPTLARLSFWVPPERMAEFERAYEQKIVSILKRHGLVKSSRKGRAMPDSVFSRLFEFKAPKEIPDRWQALWKDPAFPEMLRNFRTKFGTTRSDSLIPSSWDIYSTPAGSGEQVIAGRGRGHWLTYDVTDGLASGVLTDALLQDWKGNLWISTLGGGVSRYDGHTFASFTTKDGLVDNSVGAIFQDREDRLWFGTGGGVSLYDGSTSDCLSVLA